MHDPAISENPPIVVDKLAQLYSALAKAQGEFPEIERIRTVNVRMKSGATYQFSYAPLDAILKAVRPGLAKNGLALRYSTGADAEFISVTAILSHAGGGTVETLLRYPAKTQDTPTKYLEIQQVGSLLRYLERYATEAILGICAETDDDGNAAAGNGRDLHDRPPRKQSLPTDTVQMMTDEQQEKISELFAALKMAKPAAGAKVREVTGKASTDLTRVDAEILIAHLETLVSK